MPSRLQIQSAVEPIKAKSVNQFDTTTTATPTKTVSALPPYTSNQINTSSLLPSPPQSPPAKKQKMSLSQTYYIAASARSKLGREAQKHDHSLRHLVGHANLLDALMLELQEAEREQESWFDETLRSVDSASEEQQQQPQQQQPQPRHVQWADEVVVRHDSAPSSNGQVHGQVDYEYEVYDRNSSNINVSDEDYDDLASDSDSDSEYDEAEIELASRAYRIRASPVSITSRELDSDEEDEDEDGYTEDEYDEEDDDEEVYEDFDVYDEDLALTRTASNSPPELVLDLDSDDESPPNSPPQATLFYSEVAYPESMSTTSKAMSTTHTSVVDSPLFEEETASSMLTAY